VIFNILIKLKNLENACSKSRVFENICPKYYIVMIREKTTDWNELLYVRWEKYQFNRCCLSKASCCAERSHDNYSVDEMYVLDRIRFVHHKHYVDALLNAVMVLDTFPYGGNVIICRV
jgi:hypothetical protein